MKRYVHITSRARVHAARIHDRVVAGDSAKLPEPSDTYRRPVTAGGGTDIGTRIIAQKLQEAWGQPVVVENKPGAAGIVGTEE